MRVKVMMKKLTKPHAQFVSLVRRSASQIPFRIQKADEGEPMTIDLSRIQRVMKGEKKEKSCKVAGVVTRKMDDMEPIKAVIQKAGFSTDKMTENPDGTVLFAQTDNPEEGASLVRMSKNLILVMKGFDSFVPKLADFGKALGIEGYHDGIRSACNSLQSLVTKMVEESESPQAATDGVSNLLGGFSTYVNTLVEALPQEVFKADEALDTIKVIKAPVPPAKEEKPVATGEEKPSSTVIKAKVPSKKCPTCGQDMPEAETPAETKVEPGEEAVAKAAAIKKAAEDTAKLEAEKVAKVTTQTTIDKVLTTLAGIGSTLETVVTTQKAQAEEIKALAAKTTEAISKSAETEKALKSTVLAGAPPADAPANTPSNVLKAEDDPSKGPVGEGLWDSAMQKRRK